MKFLAQTNRHIQVHWNFLNGQANLKVKYILFEGRINFKWHKIPTFQILFVNCVLCGWYTLDWEACLLIENELSTLEITLIVHKNQDNFHLKL